jgi:hypothetical protein
MAKTPPSASKKTFVRGGKLPPRRARPASPGKVSLSMTKLNTTKNIATKRKLIALARAGIRRLEELVEEDEEKKKNTSPWTAPTTAAISSGAGSSGAGSSSDPAPTTLGASARARRAARRGPAGPHVKNSPGLEAAPGGSGSRASDAIIAD